MIIIIEENLMYKFFLITLVFSIALVSQEMVLNIKNQKVDVVDTFGKLYHNRGPEISPETGLSKLVKVYDISNNPMEIMKKVSIFHYIVQSKSNLELYSVTIKGDRDFTYGLDKLVLEKKISVEDKSFIFLEKLKLLYKEAFNMEEGYLPIFQVYFDFHITANDKDKAEAVKYMLTKKNFSKDQIVWLENSIRLLIIFFRETKDSDLKEQIISLLVQQIKNYEHSNFVYGQLCRAFRNISYQLLTSDSQLEQVIEYIEKSKALKETDGYTSFCLPLLIDDLEERKELREISKE